jgi:tetratricopeptide (TPR) repeat protein
MGCSGGYTAQNTLRMQISLGVHLCVAPDRIMTGDFDGWRAAMKYFEKPGLVALLAACWAAAASLTASAVTAVNPGAAPPLPSFRAPYRPNSDAEVLQEVPAEADPAVRAMKTLRDALDRSPGDLAAADALARAYIDFGREIGDAHYAGYAEAVLQPWLTRPRPPAAALVDEAVILQFRHQFAEARARLKQALAEDPRNSQGWLTLATIDMVQGDYDAAAADCPRVGSKGALEESVACVANLRSYLGQAQQSIALLSQFSADSPAIPNSFKSWIQGLLAESYERLGDWPHAEDHYRQALLQTPRDNYLLVGYADFLLDRQRPREVLELLKDSSQSDTAFLRLALAKATLGSADASQYTWVMGARFEALAQRGSDFFGREQVRFALYLQHDPRTALELAQRNWQVQRAPWDIRVLLEAALAANQPAAAAPVIQFVHDTKLQDPLIARLLTQLAGRADIPSATAK